MKRITALLTCFFLVLTGVRAANGEMKITFFQVEKADMFLIQTDNSTVVIDTGKNKAGKTLVEHLEQEGINYIDLLFITHFDKDHVGGADAILAGIPVGYVLEPDYYKVSSQFSQYRQALEKSKAELITLTVNHSIALDGVHYMVDVANSADYGEDEENDFSLVISVEYEGIRILFAGDAENPRLRELIFEGNLKHDVLKVPHHGKWEKSSQAFFAAVDPQYAIITSDEKEPEDQAVVDLLADQGSNVFLTRLGTVECTIKEGTIMFKQ